MDKRKGGKARKEGSERKNAKSMRELCVSAGHQSFKNGGNFNFLIFNNLLCYRRYPGK